MALNIRFFYALISIGSLTWVSYSLLHAETLDIEPVRACVILRNTPLTPATRAQLSQCLAWANNDDMPTCHGDYLPITVAPLSDADGVQIKADEVSFYAEGRSRLSGHVEIHQHQRLVSAETAYVYRDAKNNQVTKIELVDNVRLIEPDRLMIARRAIINPQDKSGQIEEVLYRFNTNRKHVVMPAWGRASLIQRFANENYSLRQATYSTCPPHQESWHIEASEINLDTAHASGVAKHAVLRVGDWPVMYAPYLTFPTSNERKSGFLMPLYGYTNIGGFDTALPYYWNIAPNYDATITPHVYTKRGVMMGGEFRYLTDHSTGVFSGQVLPQDHAFGEFLSENRQVYPRLGGVSSNRWNVALRDTTMFVSNLEMNINFQQVSDDYFLQDFSSNLAVLTENQILRQGDLTYTTDHWLFRGMAQSYKTLHPINQAPISDIYERLPQLYAQGGYHDLPLGTDFNVMAEFDEYRWPTDQENIPQGPRYHLNPVLSLPMMKPWGYVTPSVELVENQYDVHYRGEFSHQSFNLTMPRYRLDSGLAFERSGGAYTQTLEPRLFYLYAPYHDQTSIPVYDSAYMIFNTGELFRTNRFSGYDRIGDANQLAYAVTSRLISDVSGAERASLTVGQIRYFSERRVKLCYQKDGFCTDSPLLLGYISPFTKTSPIASHATYHINSVLSLTGDYVYDPATRSTDNDNINLHYQPAPDRMVSAGYSYLVNGNLLPSVGGGLQNTALHQATFAYAAPFTEKWSTLGVYSYNISKGYSMLGLFGVQYDNCCWAARLMGGRTFMSLSPDHFQPQYNTNVYFQVLLKGLGTVANSDPSSIVRTYLPGLKGLF